jgi:hypothetical protein
LTHVSVEFIALKPDGDKGDPETFGNTESRFHDGFHEIDIVLEVGNAMGRTTNVNASKFAVVDDDVGFSNPVLYASPK